MCYDHTTYINVVYSDTCTLLTYDLMFLCLERKILNMVIFRGTLHLIVAQADLSCVHY